MADLTIREATPTDFAEVAAMHYSVWRQSWCGIVPEQVLDGLTSPKTWAVLLYPRDLGRPGWRMWIAEAGGQLLGMALFGPDPDDPERLELDALYISQASHRHGVGGALLAKVLSSEPRRDVVLWCAEANGIARRFYEKNGFRLDGRTMDWEPAPGVKVPHLGYLLRRR